MGARPTAAGLGSHRRVKALLNPCSGSATRGVQRSEPELWLLVAEVMFSDAFYSIVFQCCSVLSPLLLLAKLTMKLKCVTSAVPAALHMAFQRQNPPSGVQTPARLIGFRTERVVGIIKKEKRKKSHSICQQRSLFYTARTRVLEKDVWIYGYYGNREGLCRKKKVSARLP